MAEVDLAKEPMPGTEFLDTKKRKYDATRSTLDLTLQQLHDRLRAGYDYWAPIYDASYQDVRFAYEEQWDPIQKEKRIAEQRPCINFNIIPQHINLQVGQARQSKFSARILQKGGLRGKLKLFGGPEGDQYTYGQIMEGLIRDIEVRSKAQQHYILALQHAVEGGFGWLRLRTVVPPDNPFTLEIRIEHIEDRWSAMSDHTAELPDHADASWAVISKKMTRAEYEKRYPDKQVPNFDFFENLGYSGPFGNWWYQSDMVRVCEYFYKDAMDRNAIKLVTPEGEELVGYEDEMKPILDELKTLGLKKVEEKMVATYRVKRMVCNATETLEQPAVWPGYRIPLVPVVGRTVSLGGRRHYVSFTRYARGPQEVLNFEISAMIERIGDSPYSQWIATSEQISGGEIQQQWQEAGIHRKRVLIYNNVEGQDRPDRVDPPNMPVAELQAAMAGANFIPDALGQHNANLGKASNETSGVAIRNRQQAGSVGTLDFMDNLSYALKSLFEILVDVIPSIYNKERVQRIINSDETESLVRLNETIVDEETGEEHTLHSINLGRYSVAVHTGPATMTQRQEFVDTIIELGKTNPQFMQSSMDYFFRSLDIPFAHEIAERFKKLLPRHLLSQKEQEEIPPPQPSPAEEVEMMRAQADKERAITDREVIPIQAQADVDIAQLKVQEQELKVGQTVEQGDNAAEKGRLDIEKANKGLEKEDKGLEKADKDLAKADKDIEKANKGLEKADKDTEKASKGVEKAGKDIEKADKGMEIQERQAKADKEAKDNEQVTEAEVRKIIREENAKLLVSLKKKN